MLQEILNTLHCFSSQIYDGFAVKKCEKTGEKTDHLWLNLSDGFIGGGRKNWDGSGGTNGALDHFIETGEKYPLVVKLGTITEDITTADCYSYAKVSRSYFTFSMKLINSLLTELNLY